MAEQYRRAVNGLREDDDETTKALSREQLKALLEIVPAKHRLFLEVISSRGPSHI